jgi:hypothetical protein
MAIKINSLEPTSAIGATESTLEQFQNEVNVNVGYRLLFCWLLKIPWKLCGRMLYNFLLIFL